MRTKQARRPVPLTTPEIIELAAKHVEAGKLPLSAKVKLDEARAHLADPSNFHNRDHHARMSAIASLHYSVGIANPDYQRACST